MGSFISRLGNRGTVIGWDGTGLSGAKREIERKGGERNVNDVRGIWLFTFGDDCDYFDGWGDVVFRPLGKNKLDKHA